MNGALPVGNRRHLASSYEVQYSMVASVASQRYHFHGPELQPRNLTQWRALRRQVESRHEARREQYRFRKAPVEYLAALEEKLCQQTMRS